MITLFDNASSPFARKVRLVLSWKGLSHTVIDGLALRNRDQLAAVNGRVEVPAIDHDGVIVVGSADIVAYLERRWPERPVYPGDPAAWVHARAWERCADTVIDPILVNVSYWQWAEREDEMPAGLLEAARRDMDAVYAALDRDLASDAFVSGPALSIAELALFPHLSGAHALELGHDPARFPRLHGWLARLQELDVFAADLARLNAFSDEFARPNAYERRKIFWRGDRLEWMLARGYHTWLVGEIESGRVVWPGLGVPGPRRRG